MVAVATRDGRCDSILDCHQESSDTLKEGYGDGCSSSSALNRSIAEGCHLNRQPNLTQLIEVV